ncbi:MAG: restriction endonuclease subunit S [Candidatus Omnitrophica bacterium]|nr:restriction endonuclease subunit S [Candidatus Omnitrophota bacterium]
MSLPKGWKEIKLSTVIKSLDAGVSVNSEDRICVSGECGILKTSSVANGIFNAQEHKVIICNEIKRARVSPTYDRIIMSRMNTPAFVGANAYVNETRLNLFLPDRLWQLVPKDPGVNMRWLSFVLGSSKYRAKLSAIATGTSNSMKNITKKDVKDLPICFPPKSEQDAIVKVLSTWDAAIEKTKRLVELKEKRFEWLLDELINKPASIPDAKPNGWKKVMLRNVVKIVKGRQLNVLHMVSDGKFYALNGGIEPSGYTNDWNTNENTVSISEGGNSCGFVNYNCEKFWAGGHCYTLQELKESVAVEFLYHFLKSKEQHIMKLRVGSGLPNIQKKDIENFILSLPNLRKQNQIAQALSVAQSEIKLLKQLLEQYKTQKRGLMQKLLTGQWRVKVTGKK